MTDGSSDNIPRSIASELERHDEDTLQAIAEYAERLTVSEEGDPDADAARDAAPDTTAGDERRFRDDGAESTVPDDVPSWCFHF